MGKGKAKEKGRNSLLQMRMTLERTCRILVRRILGPSILASFGTKNGLMSFKKLVVEEKLKLDQLQTQIENYM